MNVRHFLVNRKLSKRAKKDEEGKLTLPKQGKKVVATLHKHIIFENVERQSTQSYYFMVVENMRIGRRRCALATNMEIWSTSLYLY